VSREPSFLSELKRRNVYTVAMTYGIGRIVFRIAPEGRWKLAGGRSAIQARAGESNEAIDNLRYLLTIPAGNDISIAELKIDPVWDPIRNQPAFQRLLAGPGLVGPDE
jgi:hypothetical protein